MGNPTEPAQPSVPALSGPLALGVYQNLEEELEFVQARFVHSYAIFVRFMLVMMANDALFIVAMPELWMGPAIAIPLLAFMLVTRMYLHRMADVEHARNLLGITFCAASLAGDLVFVEAVRRGIFGGASALGAMGITSLFFLVPAGLRLAGCPTIHRLLWILLTVVVFSITPRFSELGSWAGLLMACVLLAGELIGYTIDVLSRVSHQQNRIEVRRAFDEAATVRRLHEQEREMTYITFHELRNPLNAVVGYLRIAKGIINCEGSPQPAADSQAGAESVPMSTIPSELENAVGDALCSCEQALISLHALNRLGKLESGTLTLSPKPCCLRQACETATTVTRTLLQPGVGLKVELPTTADLEAAELQLVLLDGPVLTQILINLLHNATKFTAEGHVSLECRLAKASDTADASWCAQVAVSDTGSGISPEVRETLYDKFASVGGIGLGLYLTRQLVQALGSELTVLSPCNGPTEGPGARFSFSLPLKAAEVRRTHGGKLTPRGGDGPHGWAEQTGLPRGLRVLVADDQASNRSVLRRVFERSFRLDWSVSEEKTAEQVLERLLVTGERFDLLVIDENFQTPTHVGIKGSEAIQQLRAAGLTLCIVSSSGNVDSAAIRNAGANSVWGKPLPDWTDGTMQASLVTALAEAEAASGIKTKHT